MLSVLRLVCALPLVAAALVAAPSFAAAQADPERPVTAPNSYRVVMENERMRMIEVHIKARSKVTVDSPAGRDRFLYMLSDGALVLNPPGKTPYEFALQAGETAVFPAVSPEVQNDTNSAVRALMVEIKTPMRTSVASKASGRVKLSKGKSRGKVAARSGGKPKAASSRKAGKSAAAKPSGSSPLNLFRANAKPAKKISGKGRGSSS